MPTAQQDTEITLSTGRMLVIFFTFVLVCAFFFAIGFLLGRKTTMARAGGLLGVSASAPSTIVRPSAAKNDPAQPTPQSGDFSFYKAVGEKNANPALTAPDSRATSTTATPSAEAPEDASDPRSAAASTPGYFVQVAAVSRQEDADALVEALKKKQYPAFIANNSSSDKFYHVQVGPYPELKDAEAMRSRLVGDGYNPIVKK